ncbi:MAG TPA: hypothetical protein VKZ81_08620 [Pseudonocardia sp.]|uniref:hypothetical protein n=1 Tax=Pseudonocardia sp. TaxID=60912 RepID=UPI002B4ADE84|nr:hypothetical protein [Pseudonocardia sp.]HLU55513.1 hypothetical protein [Pseudonocardia sp.]
MPESHLDRLVEAIEREDRAVFADPDARGRLRLAEYRGERCDPPLVLDSTEEEFDAAVPTTGRGTRSRWPADPVPEAGIELMLVDRSESTSKERRPRSRTCIDNGRIGAG